MATARFLLLLFCFVPVFGYWLPERHLLKAGDLPQADFLSSAKVSTFSLMRLNPNSHGLLFINPDIRANFPNKSRQDLLQQQAAAFTIAKKLIRIAEMEIGVKELSGNNDGPRVETYLRYVGLKQGHAWCAAFLSWVFGQAGYALPKSAWSPQLFPAARLRKEPAPALVLGIYFPERKRIAHVGLVTAIQHHWVHSIEGNTNAAGSREGEGVYRRLRHKRFILCYANFI